MAAIDALEGVLAVNKPQGISSAQVVRDLQGYFKESDLFEPWVKEEKERRRRESRNQKNRRRNQAVNVKIGHGGTLDPLATGVLIMGIGKGTKVLQEFLHCPKTYEAVVLFGVATDSYDRLGKIVSRAPFEHITREKVLEALEKFKGKQMQMPPVFSALRVQGKHLYEYAREGEEVPEEIKERPVTVYELDLLEWMEGGKHSYQPPAEEAPTDEKCLAEKIMDIRANQDDGQRYTRSSANKRAGNTTKDKATQTASAATNSNNNNNNNKRKRGAKDVDGSDSDYDILFPSRRKVRPRYLGPEPLMSGGLPASPSATPNEATATTSTATQTNESTGGGLNTIQKNSSPPSPPAIRIRMSVASGFYVRSLCHDLGKALGSMGIMCELVRTRQGPFQLTNYESTIPTLPTASNDTETKNDAGKDGGKDKVVRLVLEYTDLVKGEDHWGPKVKKMLNQWNANPEIPKEEGEAKEDGVERANEKQDGDGDGDGKKSEGGKKDEREKEDIKEEGGESEDADGDRRETKEEKEEGRKDEL